MSKINGKIKPAGSVKGNINAGAPTGTTNYNELENKPQINGEELVGNKTAEELGIHEPTKISELENDSGFVKSEELAAVATSGDYNDLENKPTIPAAQEQSDWNEENPEAVDYIKNKPSLAPVATSGDYGDLNNKPNIPSKTSDLENNSGFVTLSEIINDTVPASNKTYSSEKVEAIIDGLLPIDTASGAIANFNTTFAKPLVSLKAGIMATGGGGTPSAPVPIIGWNSIKAYQRGANLWDEEWEGGYYGSNGQKTGTIADGIRSKNLIPVPANTNIYFKMPTKPHNGICFYDRNQNFIKLSWANNTIVKTPENCAFCSIDQAASYGQTYQNDISINYPSTDTAYHAYNSNSREITINLGDTIYGGEIIKDSTGTKLRVTHSNKFDLGSLTWNQSSDGYVQNTSDILDMQKTASGTTIPNLFCEGLKIDTPTNVYNRITDNTVSIASANSRFRIYMSSIAGYTAAQVKAALTGIFVSYPLAEPYEIPLTDIEPFVTFAGENNIFADSGDILECKYKDGIQNYIDKKLS